MGCTCGLVFFKGGFDLDPYNESTMVFVIFWAISLDEGFWVLRHCFFNYGILFVLGTIFPNCKSRCAVLPILTA